MSSIDPLVSVIIPCFNREKFIGETLESALSQTYENIEIVAVDDGSTDDTRAILDTYRRHIKLLDHSGRVNRGQSVSINLAMRSTNGEYVAILDSDDVWAPEKIECQVEFLEDNPDVDLVYANGYAIDVNGDEIYKLYPSGHIETNSSERVLLKAYFSCPSSYLVRRSSLNMAGDFDETMRSAQDHDMAVRLSEVTKIAYLDEPLWFYRRHPDTQSRKHVRRRWETGFVILRKACKRYPYGLSIRIRRLAVLHFRLGQCCLEERRPISAMIRFAIAGLLDPYRAIRVILGVEPHHELYA